MKRVCHISPVHALVDNRIFYKQCHSLRDAGYEVCWVVQHTQDEVVDGIQIVALRPTKSLVRRWLLSGWEAFRKAHRTKSAVYHFHDPEFIPWGLLLRLLGNRVIYDIHEDYVSSVSQKTYIPKPLRWLASRIAGGAEKLFSVGCQRVIAERYYEQRFPAAVKVLNYPRLRDSERPCRRSDSKLLYTGNVHVFRGAKIHAAIPRLVEGTSVSFFGRCSEELYRDIQQANPKHVDCLEFTGVGGNVPYQEIARQYREGAWLAGLAIFPPNEHLERKELTKFFEYMQHGLPIIASNFPTWRQLVAANECGICVDPTDESDIAAAVLRLRGDPELWETMSQNGIRVVREKYSWISQEQQLLDLYESLLD